MLRVVPPHYGSVVIDAVRNCVYRAGAELKRPKAPIAVSLEPVRIFVGVQVPPDNAGYKQQRSNRRDQSFHSAGRIVPVCEWNIQDHQDSKLILDQCLKYFSDGIDRRYCQYDRRPNRMARVHSDLPLKRSWHR